MKPSQKDGPVGIYSHLGDDVLLVTSLRWKERLGASFEGVLDLISDDDSIDLQSMLKKVISVRIGYPEDQACWLSGFISRFESVGFQGEYVQYRATVTSTSGLLERTGGCRVFQEFTTIDIIKKIFSKQGFSGQLESKVTETYASRPYCVQYAESDIHFLHRLMEEEGIYYFFEYAKDKHTLVLADDMSAHAPPAGYDKIPYRSLSPDGLDEYLSKHISAREFGIGSVALTDYDFEKPRTPLLVSQKRNVEDSDFEWFDYPGRYLDVDAGQRLARIRTEAEDSLRSWVSFQGNCKGLRAGQVIEIEGHPADAVNQKYLITTSELSIEAASIVAGEPQEFQANCSIRCQPVLVPFRSPLHTHRPHITGPQLATVCGKDGEEIWTDSYGRIKVQFPWDRDGKSNENSSCWIRVSQAATGKNFGAMHLPRIGDEVLVEFLHGDPDQPIVTGRVFNAERMPPEELATAQAKSVFRTRSTKGGDAAAFHELTFDDTKDSESILFHSERDFLRTVENNDTLKVGFDKKSPGDRTLEIYNDQQVTIGKGSGSGSYKVTVQKDFQYEAVQGSFLLKAATSIVLECGSSKISMTPSAIEITSPSITLKADSAIQTKSVSFQTQATTVAVQADASLDLKANAQCTLSAAGNTQIKGAMVQIN